MILTKNPGSRFLRRGVLSQIAVLTAKALCPSGVESTSAMVMAHVLGSQEVVEVRSRRLPHLWQLKSIVGQFKGLSESECLA